MTALTAMACALQVDPAVLSACCLSLQLANLEYAFAGLQWAVIHVESGEHGAYLAAQRLGCGSKCGCLARALRRTRCRLGCRGLRGRVALAQLALKFARGAARFRLRISQAPLREKVRGSGLPLLRVEHSKVSRLLPQLCLSSRRWNSPAARRCSASMLARRAHKHIFLRIYAAVPTTARRRTCTHVSLRGKPCCRTRYGQASHLYTHILTG